MSDSSDEFEQEIQGVKSEIGILRAQLKAQRLRADTAEAELRNVRESHESMRADLISTDVKLSVAEQRIAELEGALEHLLDAYSKPDDRICCSGSGCGCMGTTVRQQAEYYAKEALTCAALNPNPEAESHE